MATLLPQVSFVFGQMSAFYFFFFLHVLKVNSSGVNCIAALVLLYYLNFSGFPNNHFLTP